VAKYAKVDVETCIACGACGDAAPDIFEYDDDGVAMVVYGGDENRGVTEIEAALEADLQDAVDSCPSGSILVAEAPFA
jgi:ferredoxin